MTGQIGAFGTPQVQRHGNRVELRSDNPQERSWEIELGDNQIELHTTDSGGDKNYISHSITVQRDHANVMSVFYYRGASGGGPKRVDFPESIAPAAFQRRGLGIAGHLIGVPTLAAAVLGQCPNGC